MGCKKTMRTAVIGQRCQSNEYCRNEQLRLIATANRRRKFILIYRENVLKFFISIYVKKCSELFEISSFTNYALKKKHIK